MSAMGPLHGFRIIDLTSNISGPLATMILADQVVWVVLRPAYFQHLHRLAVSAADLGWESWAVALPPAEDALEGKAEVTVTAETVTPVTSASDTGPARLTRKRKNGHRTGAADSG